MHSLLLLTALSLAGHAPAAGITYTAKAKSLASILSDLKLTNCDASAFAQVPLVIDVQDMPRETLLDDIAKVLNATWKKEGDKQTLTQTKEQLDGQTTDEVDRRTAMIEAAQKGAGSRFKDLQSWGESDLQRRLEQDRQQRAKVLKNFSGNGDASRMTIRMDDSRNPGAAVMFVAEAMQNLSAKTLASIPAGHKRVFSSAPNRLQIRLPYVSQQIQPYLVAHNRLAELAAKERSTDGLANVESALHQKMTPIKSVGKVLITAYTTGEAIVITAFIVSETGVKLDQASQTLMLAPRGQTPSPEGLDSKVALRPTSFELLKTIRSQSSQGSSNSIMVKVSSPDGDGSLIADPHSPAIAPSVRAAVSNPLKDDPLSWYVSDILLGLRPALHKNLVAHVPDTAFRTFGSVFGVEQVPLKELYSQSEKLGIRFLPGEDILIAPITFGFDKETRVNRTAYGRIVDALAKNANTSAKLMGQYAATRPNNTENALDLGPIQILSPAAANMLGSTHPSLLKLWGSASGDSVIFGSASPIQRSFMNEAAFDEFFQGIIGEGMSVMAQQSEGPDPREGRPDMIKDSEPTELFPDGLPTLAAVTFKSQSLEGVVARLGNEDIAFNGVDLGLRLAFMKEKPGEGFELPLQQVRLAKITDIQAVFRVTGLDIQDSWREALLMNGTPISLDALPESLKAIVSRARETKLDFGFGGAGQGQP